MKLIGCFIRIAAFLIIVIGISYYLYNKYEDDIYNYGKEKVETYFTNKLNEKIDSFDSEEIKESLSSVLKDYFDLMKEQSFSDIYDTTNELIDKIELFMEDNKINKEELLKLKEYIENAKPEKD